MTMTSYSSTKQQFLVTWYHPVERPIAWDADCWVISQNDDFGYEVKRALVDSDSEAEAKEAIRSRYNDPSLQLVFRSCTRQPAMETFLNSTRHSLWSTDLSRRTQALLLAS